MRTRFKNEGASVAGTRSKEYSLDFELDVLKGVVVYEGWPNKNLSTLGYL